MAWYQGPSRITVTAVEGPWQQRAVVTVRGAAPVLVPAAVGAVHVVDAASWQLDLEHCHEGEWSPNIRAVQGRWQEVRGVQTQQVHSRNRDRAGDRQDRNLVLRIERIEPGGRTPAATPGLPAARRTATADPTAAPAGAARPTTAGGPAATTPGAGARTTTSTAGSDFLRPAAPSRPTTANTATGSAGARTTTSWGA
ncbi:hypothetical protein ACFV4G_18365 [Kitasatospora sp. NPDC059747]|uniref:hypothetical protein n=1 Tax=Kitasatospora sp. NPDC059747 TaxID=3346930 RepID=UPI003652239D